MYYFSNKQVNLKNSPTLKIRALDMFFKINGTYVSFLGYISLFDILEWNMVNAVVFGLKKLIFKILNTFNFSKVHNIIMIYYIHV